jgi:hypothetical protein
MTPVGSRATAQNSAPNFHRPCELAGIYVDSVDMLWYARSLAKRDAQIHRSILAEACK